MSQNNGKVSVITPNMHPAEFVAKVCPDLFPEAAKAVDALSGTSAMNVGEMITKTLDMTYPADPVMEPDMVGLTYAQVAVLKQAKRAAFGDGASFDRLFDRSVGRPVAKSINVSTTMKYTDFLDKLKNSG